MCRLMYTQTRCLFVCVSDVTSTMLLVLLALLNVVACLDVQVEGDLAFDLRVPNKPSGKGRWFRVDWETGRQGTQELVFRMYQIRNNMTVARQVECVYPYPQKKQVDALLSNMMNELTKVFVRVNEYMNGLETRRNKNGLKKAQREDFAVDVMLVKRANANTEPTKEEENRAMKEDFRNLTRFKVVDKKLKPFFERIYNNMTDEYRKFYNNTSERVDRSERDACTLQPEAKQMWRDLLQHAQASLRRAALRCVDEYLRDTPAEEHAQMRERLKHYLKRELSKVRTKQLNMLCDTYKLCFNDLFETTSL